MRLLVASVPRSIFSNIVMQMNAVMDEIAGVHVKLTHELSTIAHQMYLSFCWDELSIKEAFASDVLLCRHAKPVQRPGFGDILLQLRALCRDMRLTSP